MKKTYSKEYLVNELDLPDSAIERELIESSRWSLTYSIVFEDGGKYWQTSYSVGATECQEEGPWEYKDQVTCVEVSKRHVTVEKWIPVSEEE